MIDYNKKINVFEAVQLLHHFLNKKYGISKETVKEIKFISNIFLF